MMKINKQNLQRGIAVAGKAQPAEIVIRNGRIIDVFNLEIIEDQDIAIADGKIVGIGKYDALHVIDAKGRYIAPALIDTHVHIESSMVTPKEFARAILPHGVTTVITDPHEIANVAGNDGIQYMIDSSEGLPLDVLVMLPSCVPATPYENSGANLPSSALQSFYAHPRVLGLAEVMDYPSVRDGSEDMMAKLESARYNNGKIDGHGAGLDPGAINVYRAAGISTDHECVTSEEAMERLRRGMYVMIREGSVAKDLKALIGAVTANNARRFLFCTDDKHLDELLHEGSIDHNVRLAIQAGLDPLSAVQIGSLNAAECYGLSHKGAVAPGYEADLLLLDDLRDFTIAEVYKSGVLVARDGSYIGPEMPSYKAPDQLVHTVKLPEITGEQLQLKVGASRQCHVIGITPNSLITTRLIEDVNTLNDCFVPSVERDQLKIAVLERHHLTGNIGLGIVKGFGIHSGAIASTVAHDSHNLVVAGTNDDDMIAAVQALVELQGGLVVVRHGKVIGSLELPISGLISGESFEQVNAELETLHQALNEIGASEAFNPFVTLSFLCLPVIPELKLTDMGLFDFASFSHIPVAIEG